MSQHDIDVARGAIARFAAGDLDGLADLYSADALIIGPEGWPDGGRFDGREAAMRQYKRVQEEWESQSMHVERQRSHADWVVLDLAWDAEGRASGVTVEMHIVGAFRVREGKIAEARFFWEFDDALAAAGLPEQSDRLPGGN